MDSELRLFTRELGQTHRLKEGGRFAEWTVLTLQALRIKLGKSYCQTVDLLSKIPGILEGIGITRLPHFAALRNWFEQILMETYHVFLGESTEKCTGHAMIDSTGFDRDQSSPYYTNRTHYRVHSLKVTTLMDVKSLYDYDVHYTTKKHDAKSGHRS